MQFKIPQQLQIYEFLNSEEIKVLLQEFCHEFDVCFYRKETAKNFYEFLFDRIRHYIENKEFSWI